MTEEVTEIDDKTFNESYPEVIPQIDGFGDISPQNPDESSIMWKECVQQCDFKYNDKRDLIKHKWKKHITDGGSSDPPQQYFDTFHINPNWDPTSRWYKCSLCVYHASTASGLVKHSKKKHKPT